MIIDNLKSVSGDIENSALQVITYVPPEEIHENGHVKYVPDQIQENGQICLEVELEKTVKKADTLFLYFAVLTGTMVIFTSGASLVWTSPVIPKLQSNNTDENPVGRPITTTEVSLIAGMPSLMMLFGSVILAKVSEIIGRKRCLQIIGFGLFSSTVLIAFSTNVILIVIFRCSLYFFFIGALTILPVYLTEICEDHNRAKYGCLMGVFLPFGNLYSYILGSIFSIRIFTLMIAAPLIYFLIFFNFVPETPVYLLSKGRKDECIKALKLLRKNKTDKEIQEDCLKIETTIKSKETTSKTHIFSFFKTREARMGMVLALGPVAIQNLSGVTVIMSFLAPIFNEAGTSLSGNNMAIIVGAIKVTSFIFTSMVVERTGRRPMLLISSIGTGLPLFILGVFFYLKQKDSNVIPYIQWLPIVCIISNVVMYSMGLGSIPMAIMGEYFPPELRALAVSFIMVIYGLILFVTTFTYPYMAEFFGVHWCVWIFSFVCFFGAIFIYKMIPETKGKSLVEIQEYLKRR